jgi:hypothetical protein
MVSTDRVFFLSLLDGVPTATARRMSSRLLFLTPVCIASCCCVSASSTDPLDLFLFILVAKLLFQEVCCSLAMLSIRACCRLICYLFDQLLAMNVVPRLRFEASLLCFLCQSEA